MRESEAAFLFKMPRADPGIFQNCRKPIWQLFFIGRSGPEDFLKLSQTDPAIFIYCHLRTWQLFFIGRFAGGVLRRRWCRLPGLFRQNCRKPIRQLFFIVTSGADNYFLLAGPGRKKVPRTEMHRNRFQCTRPFSIPARSGTLERLSPSGSIYSHTGSAAPGSQKPVHTGS